MSTALLDENRSAEEVDERPLVLDPTTRQRIAVAECAVQTLEQLADSGAWERLDPAVAEHLGAHARRLCGFLERVRHLPAVRSCESRMLAVRRSERRLEVALDLLFDEEKEEQGPRPASRRKAKARPGDEIFLGDFTNKTLTDEQRETVRERRKQKKEAKKLLTPRAKRILIYTAACFLLTTASILMVALGALQGQPSAGPAKPPVAEPMELNPYLADLQVFLPAKLIAVQQGTAVVMVRREWLLKTPRERQVDADGAHVFLQNRAIPRLQLFWEDGGFIGQAERDGNVLFAEGTSGLIGREPAAAEPASQELGPAPPGLGPPPRPAAGTR